LVTVLVYFSLNCYGGSYRFCFCIHFRRGSVFFGCMNLRIPIHFICICIELLVTRIGIMGILVGHDWWIYLRK
jgi:hypothetical protein